MDIMEISLDIIICFIENGNVLSSLFVQLYGVCPTDLVG